MYEIIVDLRVQRTNTFWIMDSISIVFNKDKRLQVVRLIRNWEAQDCDSALKIYY